MSRGNAAPGDVAARPRATGGLGQVHLSRLAQLAVTVTSDAVMALDHEGRFTFVNDAAEILLRRPRMGLLGNQIWEAFPDLRDTALGTGYAEATRTGLAVTFEAYYRAYDSWYEV